MSCPTDGRLRPRLGKGWASPRHLPGVTGDPQTPPQGKGGVCERRLGGGWGGMPELDLQKCVWDGCGWAPHCWIPPPTPAPLPGDARSSPGGSGRCRAGGVGGKGQIVWGRARGGSDAPGTLVLAGARPKAFLWFWGGGAARCRAALAQDPAPPPGSAPPPAPSSMRAHPLALIPHTSASGLPNSPSLSIPGSLLPSPSRRIPGGTESSGPPRSLGTPGLPSLHPFLG